MAIMGSSRLLIIFSCWVFLLSLFTLTFSADDDPYFECRYAGMTANFTANSTYQANLNRIVSQLSSVTDSSYGFHNLSVGEGPDKVFATALCTADATRDQCSSCLSHTAKRLMESCPWGREIVAWSQFCMVRYANRYIFGLLDNDLSTCIYNSSTSTTRDTVYSSDYTNGIGELLNKLSSEAAAGGPDLKYAADYTMDGADVVSGMVQCTPDLNERNCNSCLNSSLSEFEECCDRRISFYGVTTGESVCRVLRPNCILRVERGNIDQTAGPLRSLLALSPTTTPIEGCCIQPTSTGPNTTLRFIGMGIGLAVAVFTILLVICCRTRCLRKRESLSNRNDEASIETFFKKVGSLAPKRYSYSDIKKMTNKFKDKLGQGGFGSVFKGKLPDGTLVAVKVLTESKGNGKDFMNEVASISRTSHVHIVTLLGFCYERSKRALVYEFMAHGSLDKFIYNQGSTNQCRQLEWKTLYDIALGIARGLEYLHQGCNTRILHFDIKPHNILMDDSFCPKISDFGLSKLCERKESIISITGARGTVGYIAPEVYSRNFGKVSYKSDVYSYGMMVLEMVGGRKNLDAGVSKASEIYFPSWIYKNLDQAMNLSLQGVTVEEEEEIARKLILVSLWCIQSDPSDRPSMTKVLEMLQGSLQSLPVPPRPFPSSPVRSPENSTSSESM